MKIIKYTFLLLFLLLLIMTTGYSLKLSLGLNGIFYYAPLKNYNDYIEQYDYDKIGFGPEFGINGKLFLNPKLGVRVNINYYKTFSSRDDEKISNSDGGYYYVNNEYSLTAFSVFTSLLYYLSPNSKASLYFGGGAGFYSIKNSNSYKYKLSESATTYMDSSTGFDNSNAFGAQLILGYERFINMAKSLSLTGELNFRYSTFKFDNNGTDESAGFNGVGVIIGINYYL